MSIDTVRAAVKSVISGASDRVRNVRDYDMYVETNDSLDFDMLFRDENNDINCWEIVVTPSISIPYACCVAEHFYSISVLARRTRREDNESMKLFQSTVADVYRTLMKNRSLNNTSEPTELTAPSDVYFGEFGGEPHCMHISFEIVASELENPVTWS